MQTTTIQVTGLTEPVEIVIDRWGVPHIRARNIDDLFFAQGFNAARDRLWQIDLWRKRGLGLLARDFGPGYVAQDRASRLFLYRGDMAAEWASYGDDAEAISTAFVRGINSYIDLLGDQPDWLPPEFAELGTRPERWRPEDVVRIRVHSWMRNALSEAARARVMAKAGADVDLLRQNLDPPRVPTPADGLDLASLPDDMLNVFKLALAPVTFSRERLDASVDEIEQWATVALNGPNAAKLLAPLVEGVELTDEAFPHMSCVECTVAGMPARLFRVSFTGEVGFEVNVPAPMGRRLWEILWEAGQAFDITAYGTETMHVLRAEKGYIIVGQDTDGTVTPNDCGMGWAVGKAKPDFVGKRGLARPDLQAAGRRQLVGLLTDDGSRLEEGAQIVFDPKQALPMKMVGHVTSSYASDAVGQPIALALVEGGHSRMGETVYVPMPDRTISAKITSTVFVDPDNARLKI